MTDRADKTHRFNRLAEDYSTDLYRYAIEEGWSPERGGKADMPVANKFVQLNILPITSDQAKQFQGKGMFIAFRVRAAR
jgi:hypothetical protein